MYTPLVEVNQANCLVVLDKFQVSKSRKSRYFGVSSEWSIEATTTGSPIFPFSEGILLKWPDLVVNDNYISGHFTWHWIKSCNENQINLAFYHEIDVEGKLFCLLVWPGSTNNTTCISCYSFCECWSLILSYLFWLRLHSSVELLLINSLLLCFLLALSL